MEKDWISDKHTMMKQSKTNICVDYTIERIVFVLVVCYFIFFYSICLLLHYYSLFGDLQPHKIIANVIAVEISNGTNNKYKIVWWYSALRDYETVAKPKFIKYLSENSICSNYIHCANSKGWTEILKKIDNLYWEPLNIAVPCH